MKTCPRSSRPDEHFEDIEAWQLTRELTRLRGRSHFSVAKARPATAGRNTCEKDNREP